MIKELFSDKTPKTKEKPQMFFKSICFNDGTKIPTSRNSIVVFTGANNSGKSQVLKDAENISDKSYKLGTVVLTAAENDFVGNIDESGFFNKNFYLNDSGRYQIIGAYSSFSLDDLVSYWNKKYLYNDMHTLFIKRLSTDLRLTVSNALQRDNRPEQHPIYKLINNEALAQKLSDYFRQAFGVDLVVNRNEIRTVPLHVGKAPNKNDFTIATQDEYYKQVAKLPKLHEQGDGMRSFASILLDTLTSEYNITLIDEPEAFLHPPQARLLGKMLAKNNPNNRQLLISTHSEDFLQGLLDADNENVTVIRINREDNINKMNVLENAEIKKFWSNPILRYSNILSGLFHEKVVVCESDYDCLFYQSLINAIYEQKGEIAPDILFTHCGGKHRAKDIVSALKAVNVPVVAICDFDILNSKPTFRALLESFGSTWDNTIESNMKIIYDSMNAKPNSWDTIKKIGKAGFMDDEPAAYEKVEAVCKNIGLFIIPVGEIECFDKTIRKEKKDWVYYVLENYDLALEPKLDDARKFIKEVIDYKIVADI